MKNEVHWIPFIVKGGGNDLNKANIIYEWN